MKKAFIAGFLFISILFVSAPNAGAVTIAELQAQINALLAQLATLQAQSGNTSASPTVSADKFCYTFIRNLKLGDGKTSYDEPMVRALQTALRKEGFTISDNEGPKAGSVFGQSTEAAVIGFQEKYADEILTPNGLTKGNGFVGVSTRIKLNELYGCDGPTPTSTPKIPAEINLRVGDYSSTGYQEPTVNLGKVDAVVFTWNTKNASSCNTYGQTKLRLSDGTYWNTSNLPTSGSRTFYIANQKDGYGNDTSNTTIGVQCHGQGDTGPGTMRGINLSWTPTTISDSGAPTAKLWINSSFGSGSNTAAVGSYKVLNWSSTNATTCTASGIPGSWNGPRATSGSESVGPINQTAAYTITCYGSGFSQSATVTINVDSTATSFDYTLSNDGNKTVSWPAIGTPVTFIGASLVRNVISGTPTDLTFSFSGLPNGVTVGGSPLTLPANANLGTYNYSFTVYPNASSGTYPITVTSSGVGAPTRKTVFNLTINNPAQTTTTTPAPTAYLNNASDKKNSVAVTSGSPVNFVWGATNFTKCQMFKNGTLFNDGVYNSYGVNVPSYNGTFYVPNQTQSATYTLTCTGAGGSQSGSVAVSILSQTSTPTPAPVSAGDAYSANYSQTSSIPLSSKENTVSYTYPSNPCGGLMTDYINPGSVYVGNGPVYTSAVAACSPNTPNTTTFRVYSCSNNSSLQGQAVFAFQCNSVTSSLNTVQPNYASVYESLRGLLQQISNQIGN